MKKYSMIKVALLITMASLGSAAAMAHESGDWILRVGAATVAPDGSSSVISTGATGPLAATSVGVGDSTQLGLNIVYMMSDNLALEVLAATPFEHDLKAKGLSQYGFATTLNNE